jgi:hypothetical protein
MKVKIFWQESCTRCPPAKELGKKLETEGKKVEYYDISTPDGLAEAMFHDVLSTPSLIVTDGLKKEIATWRGETPSMEKVKKFLS